jgi:hypothetical protein
MGTMLENAFDINETIVVREVTSMALADLLKV